MKAELPIYPSDIDFYLTRMYAPTAIQLQWSRLQTGYGKKHVSSKYSKTSGEVT